MSDNIIGRWITDVNRIAELEAEVDDYQQTLDEIIVALGSQGIQPSGIVAEIQRLRAQANYWEKRHDILRDRYEPNWGNGR